jgi:hypothetical protein
VDRYNNDQELKKRFLKLNGPEMQLAESGVIKNLAKPKTLPAKPQPMYEMRPTELTVS